MHPVNFELPPGWTESVDEFGEVFFNEYSRETSRVRPIMPAICSWIKGPDEPECYHIMVKHARSRRPSSWREAVITRTKSEAIKLALEYRSMILSERKSFQEVARTYSDCPSARFSGHLGIFRSGQDRDYFSQLVVTLKVGCLNGPLDSQAGIHLLWRTR